MEVRLARGMWKQLPLLDVDGDGDLNWGQSVSFQQLRQSWSSQSGRLNRILSGDSQTVRLATHFSVVETKSSSYLWTLRGDFNAQ